MSENNLMWWGKVHNFTHKGSGAIRRLWVGPMTKEEMIEAYPEFRHMSALNPPNQSFKPDAEDGAA